MSGSPPQGGGPSPRRAPDAAAPAVLLVGGLCETPLGWVSALCSPAGVRRVFLPIADRAEVLRVLQAEGATRLLDEATSPVAQPAAAPAPAAEVHLRRALSALAAFLRGERRTLDDLPLDLEGVPPFHREALEAARQIPYGQVRSYWWVAVRAGSPKAFRAVGQAMATNPLPLILPCHRVVKTDGSLGGFGGGADLKRALLELELQHAPEVVEGRAGQAPTAPTGHTGAPRDNGTL